MTQRNRRTTCPHLILAALLALPAIALAAEPPVAVSPGGEREIQLAPSACPTFSWINGEASGVELLVSELDADGPPILVERMPRGATSWTPGGERCLAPGRYVWFLRDLDRPARLQSRGKAFEVAALPSRAEVERSLRILDRYLAAADGDPRAESVVGDQPGSTPERGSRRSAGSAQAVASLIDLGDAALSGRRTAGTGSHVGVAGIVDSPDAAGIGAQNTAGGADLVLGGPVAAEVTESQWILDDPAAQSFSFGNPSGAFDLQVQGEGVLTTGSIGNTVAAVGHGHYGSSWSGSSTYRGLYVNNSAPGIGIEGRGSGPGGSGITGTGTSGADGVFGFSEAGMGVVGSSVQSHGVQGWTSSASSSGGLFVNNGGGPVLAGYAADPSSNPPVFEVDGGGNVVAASFTGDGSGLTGIAAGSASPPSLFGDFGGPGGADRTIVGTENLGVRIASYHDLIVPAGTTLVVNRGIGWISASGTCEIAGTITAEGLGIGGGAGLSAPGYAPGAPGGRANALGIGLGMVGSSSRLPVDFAVAGGGGGGGGAGPILAARGGHGGGGLDNGGYGGCSGAGCAGLNAGDAWDFPAKRDMLVGPGATSDFFALYLHYRGGGGGAGAVGPTGGTGGDGGQGGGVVYLECASLDFTGTLDVRGADGQSGAGDAAGGGGGGGGVVLVRTLGVVANSGQILTAGGLGGSGSQGQGGKGRDGYGAVVEF